LRRVVEHLAATVAGPPGIVRGSITPKGIRTPVGFNVNACDPATYEKPQSVLPDGLPEFLQKHPDLEAVISAWPELPGAVQAGILAMIKASAKRGR